MTIGSSQVPSELTAAEILQLLVLLSPRFCHAPVAKCLHSDNRAGNGHNDQPEEQIPRREFTSATHPVIVTPRISGGAFSCWRISRFVQNGTCSLMLSELVTQLPTKSAPHGPRLDLEFASL
jgi:hypothetical protein